MPLTKKGKSILRKFKKQYGKRGEEVFYRSLRAGKLPAKLESKRVWKKVKR